MTEACNWHKDNSILDCVRDTIFTAPEAAQQLPLRSCKYRNALSVEGWEAQQSDRYEFIDGMVIMRVGASAAHTIVKGNVFGALAGRLRDTLYRALTDGLKVVTPAQAHYPDVAVIGGPIEPFEDRIREPVVIVEVLSRSSAARDRGAKWVGYGELPSLQHYVLIAQDHTRVEVFTRNAEGWSLTLYAPPLAAVPLAAIGVELALDEIYADSGC
jgi:Uma2 family endonuclease